VGRSVRRHDYWDTHTGRAGQSRGHEEDAAHRREVGDLIRAAHRAQGLGQKRRSFTKPVEHADWRFSSLQRWVEEGHLTMRAVFQGLEQYIPDELSVAPEGETPAEERIRLKKILIEIRKALNLKQLEMDLRLDQQYTTYSNFERRQTSRWRRCSGWCGRWVGCSGWSWSTSTTLAC
jgi:hypothetical protein